jgi:hypothetical protein
MQTRRIEVSGPGNCDLLLEERSGETQVSAAGPAWQKIWEFRLPSNRPKNIFTLYKKAVGKRPKSGLLQNTSPVDLPLFSSPSPT